MSSDDFLQEPELQHTHSDAVCSIIEQEVKTVKGIEQETSERMECKDKQDIQSLANQSQASATEYVTNKQRDFPAEMSLNVANGDPGPKDDSERHLQTSCGLVCPRCKRQFTSSQGLERHMQTHAHTQHFKCGHCRRTFSTLFSHRRHEKRHENRQRKPDHRSNTTYVVSPIMPGSNEPRPGRHNTSDGRKDHAVNINNDAKALNICKYCKKAFRTHTSLRRHQRRIHEQQLLPKRVCNNITITQESDGQQLVETAQDSQTTLSECMEKTSAEREYMVDISSNISENLSFYIDGKIVSTSAMSNCGLIQMTSEGSAAIGLNAVVISPALITQALSLESNTCTSDLSGQPSTKRRTSTPPLLPQIKTELESESILTASSTSLSSLSLSSTSLVATHLPESTETFAFHGERTVYLSPKLKQLLQNQDGKSALALIADGQKLSPPSSYTILPSTTKFRRRTTSPPSCPLQSTDLSVEIVTPENDSAEIEESVLDNHDTSLGLIFQSNDEVGHFNPTTKIADGLNMQQHVLPLDCSLSVTGGHSCNQQPLDLSNSVGKKDSNEALAESILDLSISGKGLDCDSEGVYITPPALRKSKPNSIMLQKFLMNECNSVDIASLDIPDIFCTPDLTNFAIMALPDSGPPNPENLLFEFTLPSASFNPTTSLLAPVNIHTAAPVSPLKGPSSSSPHFVSLLPTPAFELNQVQTICSALLVSDTVEKSIDNPIHPTQGSLKLTIPDWVSSAPGGITHTLIPSAPSLSFQGPNWVSDPALCELAQRTLEVDPVLASETQIFSTSLPSNQLDRTPLTFPPNSVVIEYTVALQSTENILPSLQADSVFSDNLSVDTTIQQEPFIVSQPQSLSDENPPPLAITQPVSIDQSSISTDGTPSLTISISDVKEESKEEVKLNSVSSANANIPISDNCKQENKDEDEDDSFPLHSFCKNFMCNVCEQPFQSMKSLSQHVSEHSKDWPYKCEFCVQLFDSDTSLLEHRSSYHSIGKIYVCKTCSKDFAFFCNLEQHQRDLHPGQECSHTEVVHGKLRPENHNNPKTDIISEKVKQESDNTTSKSEKGVSNSREELYSTIKTMASEGVKPKGPDVRLGINQHYPSFKPPPFPYHNRTPTGTTAASATNFTTHNIPQTFSTAIRCTKCGKSFDNMPELHKHILACANASDKKRYTPKKNPIPLKQFAEAQNGVLSPAKIVNSRQNLTKKLSFHESHVKIKMSILNKKKSQFIQKSRHAAGRKAFSQDDIGVYACPHCRREFTYNASLKKHVAFSCPMRPAIGKTRKRNLCIVSAQENNGSLRRHISNPPHGSNNSQKMMKSQINKSNTAGNSAQNIRLKRSNVLSTSVVQTSQIGSFIPQIVLSSPAQVNSQERGVRVHVLGNKREQRVEEGKPHPRREGRLSLRLRKRARGPVTRSTQPSTATTVLLKQSDSQNIIMRPVVLQVKK